MSCRATLSTLTVILLLLLSLAAAQSPPLSLTDVQITSISGCVDVYPITVNCSVASNTLRIQTAAGFPSSVNLYRSLYVTARIGDYTYFTTTSVWPDLSDPTNTSVFVNITASAYYPHITGALVSVSFTDYDWPVQAISAPFAGFSYRFEGPPTLTSIGGCSGSGQATLNCVPDSAVIELTGSGLLWYSSARGVQINIGAESSLLGYGSFVVQVVNDSYATVSLAWIYSELLKPQHYAGVVLSFNITSTAWASSGRSVYAHTTNTLSISFVPLPPPVVTSWFIYYCNETDWNLDAYTGCLPGVSEILLIGDYLYDIQATVAGITCFYPGDYTSANYFFCYLPDFNFDSSVAYDLVVYNDAGKQTFGGLAQYTTAPTVNAIDQCVDRGDLYFITSVGVQCPVGTTITLRGTRFPAAESVSVQFALYFQPNISVTLLAVTQLNSTAITATLPALDPATAAAVYGAYGNVQVEFTLANGSIASNSFLNRLYIPPNAPSITSITSSMCDSMSALQLTNCRALAIITVAGTNLAYGDELSLAASLAGVYQGASDLLTQTQTNATWYNSLTNTSLVFTLDYFDANTNVDLQTDVVYTIFLYKYNYYAWDISNAFRISLTYATTDNSSTSSSSKLSSGAIAGIVIAAVVAALVLSLAAVWLLRRQACGGWKSSGDGLQWSAQQDTVTSGEAYKDVELQ